MHQSPEILSTREVYKGKVFDILEAEIQHDDIQYKREIVTHRGSCVIIPVFPDETVALVRQYRYPANKFLLEIPAGTLDPNEDPKIGAARELEEEIGAVAENIEKLTEFYVSPGFLTEKMHLYLATGLTETAQRLEEDEILSIERYSFPESFNLIRSGRIEDAKTIIGLIFAGTRFGHIFQS
jgi:ADP-ribose pyrophosphatase